MSINQNLSLEECHKKNLSTFEAVLICSQEARFINEQANLGFIKLKEKPTTIGIRKFKSDRLQVNEEPVSEPAVT